MSAPDRYVSGLRQDPVVDEIYQWIREQESRSRAPGEGVGGERGHELPPPSSGACEARFPIQRRIDRGRLCGLASIPWAMIAPHEAQAQRNHHQSLAQLAERGGLSPAEALAVLEDRRWRPMPETEAEHELALWVSAWREKQPDFHRPSGQKGSTMHYRNGREAQNGDKIVRLNDEGKIEAFGVLKDAVPGNDYCNGTIEIVQLQDTYACMCDCLHIDDVAEILAEKGLAKRPEGM